MSELEQASANKYLDDITSSDPRLTRTNAIDLLVLQFAVTPEEAADAYDAWRKQR